MCFLKVPRVCLRKLFIIAVKQGLLGWTESISHTAIHEFRTHNFKGFCVLHHIHISHTQPSVYVLCPSFYKWRNQQSVVLSSLLWFKKIINTGHWEVRLALDSKSLVMNITTACIISLSSCLALLIKSRIRKW